MWVQLRRLNGTEPSRGPSFALANDRARQDFRATVARTQADKPKSPWRTRACCSQTRFCTEAEVTATGGRDGQGRERRRVVVGVAVAAEIAGAVRADREPIRSSFFAAGYAACFLGAVKLVARTRKITPSAEPTVTAAGRHGGPVAVGYALTVELKVLLPRAGEIRRRGSRCRRPRALPLFQRNARQYRRQTDRALNGSQEPGSPMHELHPNTL